MTILSTNYDYFSCKHYECTGINISFRLGILMHCHYYDLCANMIVLILKTQ